MKMKHGLRRCLTVGLDYVQTLRPKCSSHHVRESHRYTSEVRCRIFVGTPDVRDMIPGYHKRVTERGWLQREERHHMFIAVDLTGVWVVVLDDLAERALRDVCRHCRPRWLGLS